MKLKNEFKQFIKDITIDSEVEELIEKREILQKDFKNRFPQKCSENDIEVNQGKTVRGRNPFYSLFL